MGITSSDYESQIRGTIPDSTRITAFETAVESVRDAYPELAPWCTAAIAGKTTVLAANDLLKSFDTMRITQNEPPSARAVKAKKNTSSSEVPPTPGPIDTKSLYEALNTIRSTGEPPYSKIASSGNRCSLKHCVTCTEAFTRVNLTPCVGHQPCTPQGYFPHVRAGLLSRITEAHHKPSKSPKLQVKEPGTGELACLALYELRQDKACTLQPTESTPMDELVQTEEDTESVILPTEEPSYSAQSPSDWYEETQSLETDDEILQAAAIAARAAALPPDASQNTSATQLASKKRQARTQPGRNAKKR